jgi:two-component system response regulator NreC
MASGASGYVLKWQPPAEILDAIRQVAAGRTAVPRGWQALAEHGAEAGPQTRAPQTVEKLSHREREVFDLVIWGYSNKQIADRLTISIKTVETHRGHINGKLRVHTSADMVRLASLWGILTPGGDNAPRPMNGTRAA